MCQTADAPGVRATLGGALSKVLSAPESLCSHLWAQHTSGAQQTAPNSILPAEDRGAIAGRTEVGVHPQRVSHEQTGCFSWLPRNCPQDTSQ